MKGDQHEDQVNYRVVLGSAAIVMSVTVGTAWVTTMAIGHVHPAMPATSLTAAPAVKPFGMLERGTFDEPGAAELLRREQDRRLASYGWVDRDAGLVHIPIDRAMDLVARGAKP